MSISIKKMTKLADNNLMIVDALNLAFRWKHSGATDFYEDYLTTINSLRNSYKCKKVIIACDKGSSSFRKNLYPEYKQNRKDKFAEQTEAEAEAFKRFFEDFNHALEYIRDNTNYPVLQYAGVEADDIAAYITKMQPEYNIWLISSDRDWDLLINKNVSRFSYINRKETTYEDWAAMHDYSIEDYITIKCLMGDSGDNIKGIKGIGEKVGSKITSEYGDILDIVSQIPITSKSKRVQEINSHKNLLLVNYELMNLLEYCEEAIGAENIQNINLKIAEYLHKEHNG